MKKIFIVAQSEFATLVRSKAFIIGIILLPVVMAGSILLARATRNATDVTERTFAIIDHTGMFAPALVEAARTTGAQGNGEPGPKFVPVQIALEGRDVEDVRLELSDKVRSKELFAFVEIPSDVLEPQSGSQVLYYSDHPSYLLLPQWLRSTTGRLVQQVRFERAGVDAALVARLTAPVRVDQLGLVARDVSGRIAAAKQVDRARAQGVPFVFLILMFITIMSSAPQLLNTVIEEKMSRISEVLIGSVTPFQLMMGKLVGGAGVCALLAAIYVCGALGVAYYWGYADAVAPSQLAWFAFFLLMAVLLFGSIFIAVGAACTDLKDSQNLMTPVMLVMMLPMITAGSILRAPDGMVATVLSLIPTATPFLMMLRISMHPGPPAWQVALSAVFVLATVLFCVWAAGRIFRTGLLMQGKSASVSEMIRWVRQG
jgi:ABC-2 type transport system permease protein